MLPREADVSRSGLLEFRVDLRRMPVGTGVCGVTAGDGVDAPVDVGVDGVGVVGGTSSSVPILALSVADDCFRR